MCLSSPELMVLDNQPARLQVGSVVPYLSQSSQSTIAANAPVVSSINYQQTGVIMEVTPRVNSGGLVTLDVMQDVSSVATRHNHAGHQLANLQRAQRELPRRGAGWPDHRPRRA